MKIFQIYYDEETLKNVESTCTPLFKAQKDDGWYEFSVILKYLNENELSDELHYGFFSTKFEKKFGQSLEKTIKRLEGYESYDVILLSPFWDLIAYYINPFEQGEISHPGMVGHVQDFLDLYNIKIDVKSIIGCSLNACYCNYVIARREYWEAWRELANQYYQYSTSFPEKSFFTKHNSVSVPINVFVQERFPNIILNLNKTFKVAAMYSRWPSHNAFLAYPDHCMKLLKKCDDLKVKFVNTKDPIFFKQFMRTRKELTEFVISSQDK